MQQLATADPRDDKLTPADDVLDDCEVDAPARAQAEGGAEFADAEEAVRDAQGEHLCPRTECQCVSTRHPYPLEGADGGTCHSAEDVHDHGHWRSGDARISRQQLVTTKAQKAR